MSRKYIKGKKRNENENKNDGIKIATWNKGGAWNTNLEDKKDEIETYIWVHSDSRHRKGK